MFGLKLSHRNMPTVCVPLSPKWRSAVFVSPIHAQISIWSPDTNVLLPEENPMEWKKCPSSSLYFILRLFTSQSIISYLVVETRNWLSGLSETKRMLPKRPVNGPPIATPPSVSHHTRMFLSSLAALHFPSGENATQHTFSPQRIDLMNDNTQFHTLTLPSTRRFDAVYFPSRE